MITGVISSTHKVVLQISSSGAAPLYLIFNHMAGPLSTIKENGNTDTVTEQAGSGQSWQLAALGENGMYTKDN